MSYIINRFNGTQLVVLDDGTIDTSTSVGLVGRNYVGYGETQNENFVFLLENFANTAPPSRPITGQIWFNTTDNTAYAYDSTQWNPIGSATVSVTEPPNTNAGALWLKTPINQLFIYTGTEWRLIGPESVEGFASTKARSSTINDINDVVRPVIFLETNGVALAICTSVAFTINSGNSIPGFENNLQVGINLSTTAKINGSVTGNAATATQLQTARLINGVPFTGDTNITVKSSTTNYLKKGTYILGADFDGSSETTWSVDATPSNSIGKVVARNSQGGFSAGTITADLVGDVTGNVTANSGTSVFNTVQANQFVGAQLTGNAATATRLATAKTINGVNFDGTNNITVTSAAATLTGTTLNSGVTLSSLNQVGTLNSLSVADTGVTVGSGSTLRLFVDAATPTIRSNTGLLNFDMGVGGPDIFFINSQASLGLGGPSAPAIIGNNTTNLGINGYPFAGVYATNFFGNATSATTAVTATNIVGGGAGSIPYQTASGATAMLGLGTAGYVLKAQAGTIVWDALSTEQLTKGSYVNMVNTATSASAASYNSNVAVTISVDATTTNTASKIVARDASGNFSAGTITANLSGNVTGTVTGSVTGSAGLNVLKSGDTMTGDLNIVKDNAWLVLDSPSVGTDGQFQAAGISLGESGYKGSATLHFTYTGDGFGHIGMGPVNSSTSLPQFEAIRLYYLDNTVRILGRATIGALPTDYWHVTNKGYVDNRLPQYTFTSGNTIYSTSGFTNQVGSWNNGANFFDVFPPSGKTMTNLVAFIPSIAVIHYAGGVNGDDSMRCTWSQFSDRIRVYVQNTEQRSTPAANYLAIWS
jgi:hypothetical protein